MTLMTVIFQSITKEATDIEVKKAYRKESLLHHPDKVRTEGIRDGSSLTFPVRD